MPTVGGAPQSTTAAKKNAKKNAVVAGLGLPNGELFMDTSPARMLRQSSLNATQPTSKSDITSTSTSNTTGSGLTMAGLQEELSGMKDELKEKEEEHSKATIAVAATIGSLLLVAALAFAGALIYRRFVRSQHTGNNRKNRTDKLPYYDADRLLGDAAGL